MALSFNADARSAKFQASFQNLAAAANALNVASDTFGDAIRTLDEALNKLNPGVAAWVTVSSSPSEDVPPDTHEVRLGYDKVSGKWGLSVCAVTMDGATGDEETDDSWLFNDAPRNLRLIAIDHVPNLIEALAKQAAHTATRVTEGANVARQLAVSVSAIAAKETRR
jgi:hypothetical protein